MACRVSSARCADQTNPQDACYSSDTRLNNTQEQKCGGSQCDQQPQAKQGLVYIHGELLIFIIDTKALPDTPLGQGLLKAPLNPKVEKKLA